MPKTTKKPSQKEIKKTLLKEIENKLSESLKGYFKKISDKKFEKEVHKAGKLLSRHLTKEQITVAHKEKAKTSKKVKKVVEKETVS
jgi:hypothetical protein